MNVTDPKGATTSEVFLLSGTDLPIISLNYEEINLVVNQSTEIITSTFGEISLYNWKMYQYSSSSLNLISDESNTNLSKMISFLSQLTFLVPILINNHHYILLYQCLKVKIHHETERSYHG